jgi:hypothetical protein
MAAATSFSVELATERTWQDVGSNERWPCAVAGSHLVTGTTVRTFDSAMVSAVPTVWVKARLKRCFGPAQRSDQGPPISDRASAGPITRS